VLSTKDRFKLASETTGPTGAQTTNQFAWDTAGSLPLMLSDGANAYVYGPSSTPIEQMSLATASADGEASCTFLVMDAQGSVREQFDSTGNLLGSVSYDTNGNAALITGAISSPVGYTGAYSDSASGMLYLRARWYDPVTAQFVSVDPALAATMQAYGYAGEDPLNLSDPLGLWPCLSWHCLGNDLHTVVHSKVFQVVAVVAAITAVVATGGAAFFAEAGIAEVGADLLADGAVDGVADAAAVATEEMTATALAPGWATAAEYTTGVATALNTASCAGSSGNARIVACLGAATGGLGAGFSLASSGEAAVASEGSFWAVQGKTTWGLTAGLLDAVGQSAGLLGRNG
jgi:RHS repeat-associated protein